MRRVRPWFSCEKNGMDGIWPSTKWSVAVPSLEKGNTFCVWQYDIVSFPHLTPTATWHSRKQSTQQNAVVSTKKMLTIPVFSALGSLGEMSPWRIWVSISHNITPFQLWNMPSFPMDYYSMVKDGIYKELLITCQNATLGTGYKIIYTIWFQPQCLKSLATGERKRNILIKWQDYEWLSFSFCICLLKFLQRTYFIGGEE